MCTFCDIVAGRSQAHLVYQDVHHIAFLDRRPLFHGHTLLVPRVHKVALTDLDPEEVGPLFEVARLLAGAVERAMEADGTFVAMNNKVSQSVPHLHIHVVPRRPKDGLRGFFWPRHTYQNDDQMSEVAEAISAEMDHG